MHARAHLRIFGIPVRIEPFFVIVAFLFALRFGPGGRAPLWLIFTGVVLIFVSLLVHEMGHALAFRIFGQRSAIVLHGFGGFTVPTGGGRQALNRRRSITISLAGAIGQLLVLWLPARYLLNTDWALTEALSWDPDSIWDFNWYVVLYYTAFINLWWGIFNLLPIRPLDGGHVAEEVVGFEKACQLSVAAAVVGGIWALLQGWLFAALLMGLFAFINYRELTSGQRTGAFDVDAPDGGSGGGGRAPRRPAARPGRAEGHGRKGRGHRRRTGHLQPVPSLADTAPSAGNRDADIESAIWNHLRAGDTDKAAARLRQAGSSTNPFLQASVALAQGHASIALELFEAAYRKEPDGPPNLVPATLLADAGQAVPLTEILTGNGETGTAAASSLQTHLHYADRFTTAAQVGELVFASNPPSPAQTAFEVACAWARAGDSQEALRWVEAAVDAGFRAPAVLDGEPDLTGARALPGWQAIRARLA